MQSMQSIIFHIGPNFIEFNNSKNYSKDTIIIITTVGKTVNTALLAKGVYEQFSYS